MEQKDREAEHAAFMEKVYATVGRDVTDDDVLDRVNRWRNTMGSVPLTMDEYQEIVTGRWYPGMQTKRPSLWQRIVDASTQWWQAVVHDR